MKYTLHQSMTFIAALKAIKQFAIYSLLFMPLLMACSSENDLQDSVYLPDPANTGLPAYSEWGYNTFGSYYDRKVFRFSYAEVPVKVIVENGSTEFRLKGGLTGTDYYSYYDQYYDSDMLMQFTLKNYEPEQYSDLAELHDTVFDLADTNTIVVKIFIDNQEQDVKVLSGEFIVKRGQLLFVDTQQEETILSGTFEFQALINGEPTGITDGRYDLGISEGNFFNL